MNVIFSTHFSKTVMRRLEPIAQGLGLQKKTCEFGALEDEMIRDHIIQTCSSARLRRKLLQEARLTLEILLDIAHNTELSSS